MVLHVLEVLIFGGPWFLFVLCVFPKWNAEVLVIVWFFSCHHGTGTHYVIYPSFMRGGVDPHCCLFFISTIMRSEIFDVWSVLLVVWECSLIKFFWYYFSCACSHVTVAFRATPVIFSLSHSKYLCISSILIFMFLFVYRLTIFFIGIDITYYTFLDMFPSVMNFSFLDILTTNGRHFTNIMLDDMNPYFQQFLWHMDVVHFSPAWGIFLQFLLIRAQHWRQVYFHWSQCLQR